MVDTKIRTSELLVETVNEDGVTGYPFETSNMRRKLLDIINNAIKVGGTVALIDADIDNLKQLNHLVGHSTANLAIKQIVVAKEQQLAQISWVKDLWVYRPQAGGDEFRIIVSLDITGKRSGFVIEKLLAKIQAVESFRPENGSALPVVCSCGIVIKAFNGTEDAGVEYQAMMRESEILLTKQKMLKTEATLKEVVVLGEILDLDEYIDQLCTLWGAKRIGSDALRVILEHVVAKARSDPR